MIAVRLLDWDSTFFFFMHHMRSDKRRHQSLEWTILDHIYCLIHCWVLVLAGQWTVFIHVVREHPGGLLHFSKGPKGKLL